MLRVMPVVLTLCCTSLICSAQPIPITEDDYRYEIIRFNKETSSDEKFRWDPPAVAQPRPGEIFCGYQVQIPFELTNATFEAWEISQGRAHFGGGAGNGQYAGKVLLDVKLRYASFAGANVTDQLWRNICHRSGWSIDHVKIDNLKASDPNFTGCIGHIHYKNGQANAICF